MRSTPPWSRGLRFAADLAALAGGAGAAQAVTLASTLWITRLYAPEDVGPASLFLSLVALFSSVAALRFDKAIVLPAESAQAGQLIRLSLIAASVACGGLAIAVALASPWLSGWGTLAPLGGWIYALPVVVWLATTAKVAGEHQTRQRAFGRLGASRVVGSTTMAVARIGSGLAVGGSAGGYLLGGLLSWVTQLAVLTGVPDPRRLTGSLDVAALRSTARTYQDFPRFSVPTTFLNRLSDQLPILMLSGLYAPEVVGLYALTQRALRSPLDMVSEALRRVVHQRSAACWNAGEPLAPLIARVTLGIGGVALVPLLGIALWGSALFGWAFGDEWARAGDFAAALVPWMLTDLLIGPANAVFFVTRHLRTWLLLEVFSTLSRLAVFGLAWWLAWDVLETLVVFAWWCVTVHAVIIAWGLALARQTAASSGDA